MDQLAPAGEVYQAGTLSGNPLATAAGLAVLGELDRSTYLDLSAMVGRFAVGLADAVGADVQVPVAGPLVGVFFSRRPVGDYDDSKASAASGRYPALMHGLLERGVAIAPGAYEVFFPSLAHSDADLARTVEAFGEVVAAMRE
jgi:glutamate-1-semialdehyde 2,1-aminomutase